MTPEGKFKKKVCSELKKLGATILQYKQDSTTVKGFPDTLVLLTESLVIFIDFKKSKTAKFQPLQKEWNKKLNERGFFAYIMYPENEKEVMAEIRNLI